ncbi:MAG TPA: flagellar export chaperone FliS [Burkholderiaceae bacterium]|nr:flagellar export chaperone FliS [Burkholderiaceae bacterium]
MGGFGAGLYSKVGVESGVGAADPHRLILMLFDGALESMRLAAAHLAARQVAQKCAAITKASRIVNEGLRSAVNRTAAPELGERLVLLYDYVLMQLLQGNLRNDPKALSEAQKILGELRDAWAAIAPGGRLPAAAMAPVSRLQGAASLASAAAPRAAAPRQRFTAAA